MPTREIYWNVPHHQWLYLLAAAALAVMAYGLVRRWRLISAGGGDLSVAVTTALRSLMMDSLIGRRLWRRRSRGLAHAFILWGAVALTVGTLTVFLESDFGLPVYRGSWYLFITLAMDLLGLLAIAGVLVFLVRRLVRSSVLAESAAEDLLILGALLFVLIVGFVLEGMRLSSLEDPWRAWSPVGIVFSLPFEGSDAPGLVLPYRILWWTHLVSGLALLAWLPFSKLAHVVIAPVQQALHPEPASLLPRLDFEDETQESYGLANVNQLDRRRRLALEACTDCRRCQEVCPATATGKSLSPRHVVLDLRTALESKGPVPGTETEDPPPPISRAIGVDAIWECLTCNACVRECPVYLDQPLLVLEMRQYLTMSEGQCPPDAEIALRNLEVNHNPWGFGRAERAAWAGAFAGEEPGLDATPPSEDGWLLWVGCAGAFDPRAQKVASATVRLLQAAAVPFAILGVDEQCCGDPARRMGNEYLFQILAEHNITAMKAAGVRRIVTICPHCRHVLGREYPQFGGDFEVVHHSELLAALVAQGRLRLPTPATPSETVTSITYHDSCYLARHSGVVSEPRRVLDALPQVNRGELPRSGDRSFCCGGGGGHVFMEEPAGERISHVRLGEIVAAGFTSVATACPYCLTMLEDAAKACEAQVTVSDLAELVDQAVVTAAAKTID